MQKKNTTVYLAFCFLKSNAPESRTWPEGPTPAPLQPLGGVGGRRSPSSFATPFLSDPSPTPRFVPSPRQLPSARGSASAQVPASLLPLHADPVTLRRRSRGTEAPGRSPAPRATPGPTRQDGSRCRLLPSLPAGSGRSPRPRPCVRKLPAPGIVGAGGTRRGEGTRPGPEGSGVGRRRVCRGRGASGAAPARSEQRPARGRPGGAMAGTSSPEAVKKLLENMQGDLRGLSLECRKKFPPVKEVSGAEPSQAGPCWAEPGGGRRSGEASLPRGPAGAQLPACPRSSPQPGVVLGELRPPRPRAVPRRGCACRVFCGCCFQCAAEAGAVGRAVPLGERGWRTDRLFGPAAPSALFGKNTKFGLAISAPPSERNSPEASSVLGLGRPGVRARREREPGGPAATEEGRAQPRPALRLRWEPGAPEVYPRVCALPLSRSVAVMPGPACLIPDHCTPVAAGVSWARRSSSLPRRFGVVWLSNGVGTTEEVWETQKFGLLVFPPFLKIPLRTVQQ